MERIENEEDSRGLFVLPMNYAERMSFIESEMIQTYQEEKLPEDKRRAMLSIIERANSCIRKRRTEELRCSGSVNSGFATNTSDLDIAIILHTDWSDSSLEYACNELEAITSLIKWENYYRGHEVIRNTRVPIAICKMECLGETIDVDLIPHPYGEHGCLNSLLLRLYGSIHPYVPILGIVIKTWARERGINNTRTADGLSSYTYIIMLIAFLQRIEPEPLLPFLQDCPKRQRMKGVYDFSFREAAESDREKVENWSKPLAETLLEFFRYYAEFDWSGLKVDIKDVDCGKEEPNHQMVIQDPFIRDRNLADVLKKCGAVFKIKREFKRAYTTLLRPQSSLKDLFSV